MNRLEIIKALDEEIARLHSVRELLRGTQKLKPSIAELVSNGQPARKRVISAAGRRRIAEAQKRRWAKQKRKSK
jgi:hypothetical protein